MLICGKGLYEATIRRVRFTTADKSGVREVTAEWERTLKAFKVTIPPF